MKSGWEVRSFREVAERAMQLDAARVGVPRGPAMNAQSGATGAPDRAEVLQGVLDQIDHTTTPTQPAGRIWFDGGRWSRRPMRPGEDRNIHGQPWPQTVPSAGWWIFTRTHYDHDGIELGGTVIDTNPEHVDLETGELVGDMFVLAVPVHEHTTRVVQLAGGMTDTRPCDRLTDIRKVPVGWDDIDSADPPRPSLLQQTYDDIQTVLGRRANRGRHNDPHVAWLRHARHTLEGLLAA